MPVLNRQPLGFITHKVSKNAVVLHSSLILYHIMGFLIFFFLKGGGVFKRYLSVFKQDINWTV